MKGLRVLMLVILAGLVSLACWLPPAAAAPPSTPTLTMADILARAELTPTPDRLPASSPTTAAICQVQTGYPTGTVNVRGGAGMGYSVLAVVEEGAELQLTGRNDPAGWAEVITPGGLTGWFYTPKWCK